MSAATLATSASSRSSLGCSTPGPLPYLAREGWSTVHWRWATTSPPAPPTLPESLDITCRQVQVEMV